jgi:ubiquinone/menaquinone biosynthesis C-methylase UbiE
VSAGVARYEGLAEWYDEVMRDPGERGALAVSAYATLADQLGPGRGWILDVGVGTGLAAERVRRLGYEPFGVDLSFNQLQIASGRLPVVQSDAAQLPLADESVANAYSTFVSSDLDDLEAALREVHRVLVPGGRYVSICVHPALNGGHSELRDDDTVVVEPGYTTTSYRSSEQHDSTIRSHVGAWHRPLAALVNAHLAAGFRLTRLVETGPNPLPLILGITVEKP